ncbi:restriction endonuclease subunit S [Pediococcus ethanolidurans]|uniref:restriction endonuclease subunit S n=1 Tax=Pediococcus ethanolidurans TaxID=319653 RepID=UPI001C1F1CA1|nr:restriction endonuclease subunit S [Pediococcus ethanolidurans]MBU7563996.1 restriction endonuclease subunit S [Pediococcus ethanolidurans]MCV3321973.1 restriction endonuclease subunit S [Pediococcus ethanolidurans]MCV3323862.1 restriction endonuclease subunit S [Pediococcus ethanolidurans]
MSEKIQPKVRFFGFTDAWEQRKLETLGSTYSGLSGKSKEDFGHGNAKFVTYMNVFQNSISSSKMLEKVEVDSKQNQVKRGDVFFTTSSETPDEVGMSSVWQFEINNTYLNSFCFGWRPKANVFNSKFLAYILRAPSLRLRLNVLAQGISRYNISKKALMKEKIYKPSLPEQTKIGELLSTIDSLIAANQSKLEELKTVKKLAMQKIFDQEWRFKGFTDPWEQRKLGEVADIIGGGTPSTNVSEYWNGDIDWYSPVEIGNQIYIDESQKKITGLGLQKSSAHILPVGTVLFTSRAGIGNTAILAKEGCTNQGFQSIVPYKDLLNSYFIFSRTSELKRYGEINGAGSTFIEVSGKQMAKMPISVPSIEEQQKIGTFFKQLDDTITLHQQKCDQLKKIKKWCMQNLFV